MSGRLETPEQARHRLEADGLRGDERARLWQRIEEDAEQRGRWWQAPTASWLIGASAAVGLAALVALFVTDRRAPEDAPVAAPVPDVRCELLPEAGRMALPADCAPTEVEVDGDHWELAAGASVEKAEGGARVVRGQVRFRVRHRESGEQFRVGVSHGQVRVIGTVFTIVQRQDGGSVAVSEGVIEFVWNDGAREHVHAGETLRWPRATPEPEPEPEASEGDEGARTPRAGDVPDVDADQVIARLLQLRSQRRHGEAVDLLAKTLKAPGLSTVQRERISYELGLSLEAASRDACPHWQRHARRFGARLHEAELAERLRRCQP